MNTKLWKQAYKKLDIYGDNPPALCLSRLAAESSALDNTDAIQGFAVAAKMMEEAKRRNEIIITNSMESNVFAAWLLGATLVNPLPPHYRCPNCGHTEFIPSAASGFDLPPKKSICGSEYIRDGHNLPYEVYALSAHRGLYIDIYVSDDFKPTAVGILRDFYKGTAEILSVKLVDDAGVSVEEKYAVLPSDKPKPTLSEDGFWHAGFEEFWIWCEGVFCYTLKHNSNLETVLGLQKATGAQLPDSLTLTNPAMAAELLEKRRKAYETEMLKQHTIDRNYETPLCVAHKIQPTEKVDFELLLQIDGLGHATGAWTDNGEILLLDNLAGIRELPVAREDVWNMIHAALMKQGISDSGLALQITDQARRGVYARRGMPKLIEQFLRSADLPDWLPDYLRKNLYLFPKGHIIAHLQLELIFEWFRMNYPAEFKE